MATTGAVIARILTQYSDKGSKAAQKDIVKLGKKIDAFGAKAAKSFKLAIVATAALSVKIGKDAVEAAIEDSKSQAVLALAMANTTGVTKEAIEAAEDYIKRTMFRVNVADDELRKSLASLYIATGNLGEAQRLQTIALDVAAASGKDLASATTAITRAQQGNVTSLKRLSPELSGLIKTGMKAEEVFALLEGTYGGTAETLALLDPLTNLKLKYGEVLETLGYELLPIIEEFAKVISEEVVPAVEQWIKANGSNLREGIRAVVNIVLLFSNTLNDLGKFYNQFDWLIKLGLTFFALGRAIKVAGGFGTDVIKVFSLFKNKAEGLRAAFDSFIGKLIFTKGPFKKFLDLIYKGFQLVGNIAGAFVILGTAIIVAKNAVESFFNFKFKWPWQEADEGIKKTTYYISGLNDEISRNAKSQADATKAAARAKLTAAARAAAAAAAVKEAAKAKIAADAEKLRLGVLEKLKKIGVKPGTGKANLKGVVPTSTLDPAEQEAIQFEAARLNLVKQGNLAEAARIALIAKSREAVVDLAKAWGGTKEQVEMYNEFVQYLNDGKLSDAEIVKLQEKWGLTSKQVQIYADIITKASDKIISDAEIIELAGNWGLTTDQVLEYIKKIGQPVIFSGTLVDPALLAALGWKDALDALLAYRKALTGEATPSIPTTSGPIPGSTQVYPGDFGVGGAVGEGIAIATEAMIEQFRAAEAASTLISGSSQVYAGDFGDGGVVGGFTGSPTMNNALGISGIGSSDSGVVVNLTVNGSVTTENDLITTIRNGLLRGQYNGQGLALATI